MAHCYVTSIASLHDFDCNTLYEGCSCPPLRANQAVAGPGVKPYPIFPVRKTGP